MAQPLITCFLQKKKPLPPDGSSSASAGSSGASRGSRVAQSLPSSLPTLSSPMSSSPSSHLHATPTPPFQRKKERKKRLLLDSDDDEDDNDEVEIVSTSNTLSATVSSSPTNTEASNSTPSSSSLLSSKRLRPVENISSSKRTLSFEEHSLSKKDSHAAKKQKRIAFEDVDYEPSSSMFVEDGISDELLDSLEMSFAPSKPSALPVGAKSKPKPTHTPSQTPTMSRLLSSSKTDRRKERLSNFQKVNEQRYSWLSDDHRRDAKKRSPTDPDYDATTLYIPPHEYGRLSSFEKQYWDIKSKNMDIVLFFKKGKFYELYEMDADIGVQELDLKLTDRVNMRMTGVPEKSYQFWASKLLAKGFKVGRVEQMEAAKKKGPRDVVRRELCQILTAGTISDMEMVPDDMHHFLLSLKEDALRHEIAAVLVDASIGSFFIGTWCDDSRHTELETFLQRFRPKELLTEEKGLSQESALVVRRALGRVQTKSRGFFDRTSSVLTLKTHSFLGETVEEWPDVVRKLHDANAFGAMEALANTFEYLKELMVLDDVMSSRQFFDLSAAASGTTHMTLDGRALANLEVLVNLRDGSSTGTLWALLERCSSPFGRRTLRTWVANPLLVREDIEMRLDAVEEMMEMDDLRDAIDKGLRKMGDLERLLSRMHHHALRKKDVYMVDNTDLKKVKEFFSLVSGLQSCIELVRSCDSELDGREIRSIVLRSLFAMEGSRFPDIEEASKKLETFSNAFSIDESQRDAQIVIRGGMDAEYDEASACVRDVETALEAYLKDLKREFSSQSLSFRHVGKELFQIEIPRTVLSRHAAPTSFQRMSQTKDVIRFWTPNIRKMIEDWERSVEKRDAIVHEIVRRIFEKFDSMHDIWRSMITCMAEIDCILSLARTSIALPVKSRPTLFPMDDCVLEFYELRHPCIGLTSPDFVPNDTILGGESPPIVVLTGPNMGGKSTLLRQVCLATIMAQIGCFVPAVSCALSPVDRIFTRVGASDHIMSGESTFMVELSETSSILNHATRNSLVILDELGRGTSTHDGYAIACAVVKDIADRIECRTLLSTHYQALTEEVSTHPNIALHHMQCNVDEATKAVTFLYKVGPGVCPKSHGMHVALLAGIPRTIVDRASFVSSAFEQQCIAHDHERLSRRRSRRRKMLEILRHRVKRVTDSSDFEMIRKEFLDVRSLVMQDGVF